VAFICHKFCHNKEDAEEVVQDTFLVLHRKMDTLRAETLIAYMQRIAINACYRKRRSIPQASLYDPTHPIETQEETDADFLPEEYLHNKEQRTDLLRIIMSLPRMQWETVYLYYYASYSVEEIAALQACSVSNVCKTLRTARQSIKDYLEGKRKHKRTKAALPVSAGMVSLAALLFMEEQVFAAAYSPGAALGWGATGTATAAAVSTTTASASMVGYVAIACTVAVVAVSAVVYYSLAFRPAHEDDITMPVHTTAYTIAQDFTQVYSATPLPLPTVPRPPDEVTPVQIDIDEPQPEPTTPASTQPGTSEIIIYAPATTSLPTVAPPPVTTPAPTTNPPPDPEPTTPPAPVDRTAQIMAALAQANSADAVAQIIEYYGFAHERYVRGDGERFYFYTANEGSGDILIGNATTDNGTWQRMHFALFNHHAIPTDVIDLIIFMESN